MNLILLHGATGIWDEVVCLVVPATAIMGVALAVLRQQPGEEAESVNAAVGETPQQAGTGTVPGQKDGE